MQLPIVPRLWRGCGLLEVVLYLTVATLWVAVTPDRRLPHLLGDLEAGTPELSQSRAPSRLGRDIEAIARRLPWHPRCLVQAVAAQRLLRRRGLPAVVHLAVTPGSQLEAHAWVSSQGRPVVGRRTLTPAHVHVASYALATRGAVRA